MSVLQRMLFVSTAVLMAASATANAEPCVLAYPAGQTIFRYDPDRYEVLSASDDQFDLSYSLGGQMLWDKAESRVAVEVYRAPGLSGFQRSSTGNSQFHHTGSLGALIIDGFSASPRQLSDVCVQFTPRPGTAPLEVKVNGVPVSGLRHVIPRFVVSTPTGDGFFSDEIVLNIEWSGTIEMDVVVYSDRNANRIFDGEPVFSVVMREFSVPTENATWGSIKAIYGK